MYFCSISSNAELSWDITEINFPISKGNALEKFKKKTSVGMVKTGTDCPDGFWSLSMEILKTQLDVGLARLFQLTLELRAWTR